MNILISGAQPSGNIHIGNYISMRLDQNFDGQVYVCIADMHALTSVSNVSSLYYDILSTFAIYYTIFKESAVVFLQSSIPYHAHLMWLLSCFTKTGHLNRMTQFKDKSKVLDSTLGLYAYPVLMAADILLYRATHVKVGDDQIQHLELVKNIIEFYNFKTHNIDDFIIPEMLVTNKRIMNLRDSSIKMSKSTGSKNGVINILDDENTIMQKIQKAQTDSELISFDLENRQALRNLKNIYESLGGDYNDIIGKSFSFFKKELADIIISSLKNIRHEASELMKDQAFLLSKLYENNNKMLHIAEKNIKRIMLLNPLCYHDRQTLHESKCS